MKKIIILISAAIAVATSLAKDAPTWKEFKRLSPKERKRALAETTEPRARENLAVWDLVLTEQEFLGIQRWRQSHATLLVSKRGFGSVDAVFSFQQQIRRSSKDETARADASYNRAIDLLVTLAKSPEAMELEEECEALLRSLGGRFPKGLVQAEHPEAVAEIDRTITSILGRLHNLPQLSAKEVDEEYDALFPRPAVRGLK